MKRTRLKPQSAKGAERNRKYRAQRELWLPRHDRCEIAAEGCSGASVEVHHTAGRVGRLLLDESTWLAVCRPCHRFAESNRTLAYERGWLRKRVA